jgi:hypothetical protein
VIVDVREWDADDKGELDADDNGEVGVHETGRIEEETDDNGGSLNI